MLLQFMIYAGIFGFVICFRIVIGLLVDIRSQRDKAP
jgi:hypothetical protein